MLKAGIFLDVENLTRNGGWGLRYDVLADLVTAQNAQVIRANAYLGRDREREAEDADYRRRAEEFRNAIRRTGFHLVLKDVRRYRNDVGDYVAKANCDLDLAVDALLQSENLDYIMIGSGDGDLVRLVRAIQNRGKRVDLLSFANASSELRKEVDYYFPGFLVPDLLPDDGDEHRHRGVLYSVVEDKGYGFATVRTGLGAHDVQGDVFCHINDFANRIDNQAFAAMKTRETILEFDLIEQEDGRLKAENISEFDWNWRRNAER